MPLPKGWKLVSGTLGVAVALGAAGVAIASDDGNPDDIGLDDVKQI
jgi:hypothetical protein